MTALTVRALTAADYASWKTLWDGYLVFYEASLPDETTQTTFRRLLEQNEPMHAALAEVDGVAVGLVHFIEHRTTWSTANTMYLQDLFVSPSARRQRVGEALIEHVYRAARQLGCAKVYWLTHETNHTAMALYNQIGEKSGFVHYRNVF